MNHSPGLNPGLLNRLRIRAIALACLISCAVIGTTVPASAIGGGKNAPSYSFMSSIQVDGSPFCGAVLIDAQAVLTAWHCVAAQPLSSMKIRIGSNNLRKGGTVTKFVGAPVHVYGDSALVWLARSVPEKPIPLASGRPPDGASALTMGWGFECRVTDSYERCHQRPHPQRLQQATGKFIDSLKCGAGITPANRDTVLCVQHPAGVRDAYGDSGGPLLVKAKGKWVLAGTLSGFGADYARTAGVDLSNVRSMILGMIHRPRGA